MTLATGRTAAIILHHGPPAVTANAIRSILKSTVPVKVIVVNNGRLGDIEAIEKLARCSERLSYLGAGINLGFAAGVNLGIDQALATDVGRVLLLNNDAAVEPNTLELLISVAERQPDFGILAPIIFFAGQANRVWSAGLRLRRGTFWTDFVPVSASNSVSVVDVDAVTGAAMLVTRATIDRVGLFDERYFMYFEDVDYCVRAKNAGFRVGVVGGATAYHLIGPQPRLADSSRVYRWSRSRAVFYTRLAGSRWGGLLAIRLIAGCLAFGWNCIRRGDPVSFARYVRATIDGWRTAFNTGDHWTT